MVDYAETFKKYSMFLFLTLKNFKVFGSLGIFSFIYYI